MPISVPCVIIPYERFMEFREHRARRRRNGGQPVERDSPRAIAIDDPQMSSRPPAAVSEPPNGKQC